MMTITKHSRGNILFMIMVFSSLGLALEVIFTAFLSVINNAPLCNKPLIALAGNSYAWMIFIYALIPVLGIYGYERIKKYHTVIRLLIYILLIYLIEFTSGYILQKITGSCPWKYNSGWNIMGFIRLDYFPAWLLFGWIMEKLFVYMTYRFSQ